MNLRQNGVAMIELSIVLPLLLAICFGITEFGRAIYSYNTLAKAARNADRYLSTKSPSDPDWNSSMATATNLAVYGNTQNTGTPLLPNLKSSQVKIVVNTLQGNASNPPQINTVTLTIRGYQFSPIIDLLRFTNFYTGGNNSIANIVFGDISVTMRQN